MDPNISRSLNDSGNNSVNFFIPNNNFQCAIYTVTGCVVNVILSFAALSGNSIILITIWKTSSLHSASIILLSSLALSDLLVAVVQPQFAVLLVCKIDINTVPLHILATFSTIASFMIITAIGVDRLLALQLHLRYEAVVTTFRVKLVLISIWLLSAVVAISRLWMGTISYGFPPVIFVCLLVANFVVYLKMYLIVRRHQRQIQHQQQEGNNKNSFIVTRLKKSALNTFLVCILLLFCYLPYSVYIGLTILHLLHTPSPSILTTTITFMYLNSSLNPLLYCWRDRHIRTAVKQLFRITF